ncbi:hypothetical protein [Georgenia thermotolerans]|uniref:Lipoprotein n=1 Tax=Georgenia thermotolerans TaxID=527326 RepID=A0A7J5UNS4_9MICO|nr:hypothetical protein [Georgenia thermotolerans]KAE8764048.1 hypothetical protein GB883_11035 [Georgenia thermotolerans]
MSGRPARTVVVLRHAAVAAAVGMLAAGCGNSLGPGTSEGFAGTAIVVQDVEGLGSQPIDEGWVIAIPTDRIGQVLTDLPEDQLSEPHLQHVTTPVATEDVRTAGGSVGELDGGRFTLEIEAREYFACLVRDTGQGQHTSGCDLVDLPATGTLELTTGEGGVRVEVP